MFSWILSSLAPALFPSPRCSVRLYSFQHSLSAFMVRWAHQQLLVSIRMLENCYEPTKNDRLLLFRCVTFSFSQIASASIRFYVASFPFLLSLLVFVLAWFLVIDSFVLSTILCSPVCIVTQCMDFVWNASEKWRESERRREWSLKWWELTSDKWCVKLS